MSGEVEPEGIMLNYIALSPPEIFWRMVRFEEFDASELSCATYFTLRSRGDERFIAIPVFPSRSFRHSGIYVNTAAGIRAPADLKGKRLGCAEYHMTMAVWVRALLQHEYGVLASDMRWVLGGLEEPGRREKIDAAAPAGVAVERAPSDRSLAQLLDCGDIDALLSPSLPSVFVAGAPRVARLFPDYARVEADYYRRTRIFPIMHTVVLRRALYERDPWAAVSLYKAFGRAKELAFERIYDSDALPVSLAWTVAYVEEERALRGEDLWAYGFAANRPTLEALKGTSPSRSCCSGTSPWRRSSRRARSISTDAESAAAAATAAPARRSRGTRRRRSARAVPRRSTRAR